MTNTKNTDYSNYLAKQISETIAEKIHEGEWDKFTSIYEKVEPLVDHILRQDEFYTLVLKEMLQMVREHFIEYNLNNVIESSLTINSEALISKIVKTME